MTDTRCRSLAADMRIVELDAQNLGVVPVDVVEASKARLRFRDTMITFDRAAERPGCPF